jgi:DNA topoisomerase-1
VQIARLVRDLKSEDRSELFGWADAGAWRDLKSADLTRRLREDSGLRTASAKDLRTWRANHLFVAFALESSAGIETVAGRKRRTRECLVRVGESLGNTAAVVRSSYVHPALIDDVLAAGTLAPPRNGDDHETHTRHLIRQAMSA